MIENPPESPAEEQVDHSPLTWSRVIGVLVIVQFIFIIGACLYFAWATNQQNMTFAARALAQSRENNGIIQEIRNDLDIHARASTDRNCAIADELRYLVRQSPDIKPRILRKIDTYTKASCLFIPPHVIASLGIVPKGL